MKGAASSAELVKEGVQTDPWATRHPKQDAFCFSSGSSNRTSPPHPTPTRPCLLLPGNWVALLSWCDSSAAHYFQRLPEDEATAASLEFGHYNGTIPGTTVRGGKTTRGPWQETRPLQSHKWCTHPCLKYSSRMSYYALSFALIIHRVK